jgi:hypothetical protein
VDRGEIIVHPYQYYFDSLYRIANFGREKAYEKAHDRKETLRRIGYRVKIDKNSDGDFIVYKKHVSILNPHSGRVVRKDG